MRLKSITLTNFRQFKGQQSFDLTSTPAFPVAMLFGANGAGKTTLLNAFSWALYGTMSSDVEQQERIVTDAVWRSTPTGKDAEVAVEVRFSHGEHDYRLLRQATLRKESDQQGPCTPEVHLWSTKPDGSSVEEGAPQEKIKHILPEHVSRFFFFNGERIENLVKQGSHAEVKKDIKVLLNMEHVERAIDHLSKGVYNKLAADIRKYGGGQASSIQEAIDDLRQQEVDTKEALARVIDESDKLTQEREEVADVLRQHEKVAPIQAQRDTITRELAEARRVLRQFTDDRALLVATRGFQAFTDTLCTDTQTKAEGLYKKGELPAPLKREFVDELLSHQECICGTPLAEGSAPWDHVSQWRRRAGLQVVEGAWQQVGTQSRDLVKARDELRERLASITGQIANEADRVARLEDEKADLDGQLANSRLEDVHALEAKRMELDRRISLAQRQIGVLENKLESIHKEIDQKQRDLERAEVLDVNADKARSRSAMVRRVQRALEEILAIRESTMRVRLDEQLKGVFCGITHQNHIPVLGSDYKLGLFKDEDGVLLEVPKSTGENQILSLSFVAAVSRLARESSKELGAESGADGVYPIVMDAAFGSLDEDYQEAVSRALATLAPQLVVLVSKSQGLGRVLSEMMPHISHLGIIEQHTTAPDKSEEIVLQGTSYPYIKSDSTDHSELKAIK